MAFDLDDEELKATRMMNGADRKGRVNKMEQDINKNIKILERMLKIEKECLHYDVSQDEIRALEHLIKAYKELEEKNKKKSIEIICYQEELENSIPVSLVEEKIEELNRKIKYEDNEKVIIWLHKQRKILQELLEKRK